MSPRSYSRTLAVRERAVLQLIWEGLTYQQMSRKLGISARTVGNHVARVFDKLGVNSSMAAVRKGLELGVLLVPERHTHAVVHYCEECQQVVTNIQELHVPAVMAASEAVA